MMGTIHVTDADFETQVLQSPTPVLVDFWAEWCGPCKMIAPILEQLAGETEGVLTIAKLNVEDNPQTQRSYRIMNIPLLILFKDGQEVKRILGFKPKRELVKQLSEHVEGLPAAS